MTDASPRYRLEYTLDGQAVQMESDQPVCTLGRSADCAFVFPDSVVGISRKHATIVRERDGWHLVDKGSRNGTYVNTVEIKKHRLQDGDVINLGPLEIKFSVVHDTIPVMRTVGTPPANESPPNQVPGSQVEFNDAPAPDVSVSINMADLGQSVGSRGGERSIIGSLRDRSESLLPSRDALPPPEFGSDEQMWGINLFSEIGRALVSSTDLETMLNSIMEVVFKNVPSQRGVLCLYDPVRDELDPKVFRSQIASGQKAQFSRTIARRAIDSKEALLVSDAAKEFAHMQSVRMLNINSAMCVPLYHDERVEGLIYVDTDREPFGNAHLQVLSALALFSAVAIEQARLRDELLQEQRKRENLARYFSPQVVEWAVQRKRMTPEEKPVSVLFADLSGFTGMSERMSAPQAVHLLNEVFGLLHAAVFQEQGTLDKFMGDGMLAFFGAPKDQDDHAVRAVRCALDMQQRVAAYNEERPNQPPIRVRIGINSGTAVVGDIGSQTRTDYSVIGDTVNIASRLESSVAKPGQIVIGPSTHQLVARDFDCERLESQQLKGRTQAVQPYVVQAVIDASRSTAFEALK